MILAFALLPSIVLLIYIYKKDTREKEPIKFLLGCFGLGVLSAAPAMIMELIGDGILSFFFTEGSFFFSIIDGFLIVGFAEELCKYLLLRAKTWKSSNFNCMYDGIVYSVFVSLGFATLENILYVIDGGLATALMRMFTSIPGHTSFAVYMGYFYSKAKLCDANGDYAGRQKNNLLALVVPIILHGAYDTMIFFEEDLVGSFISTTAVLGWFFYVLILFAFTFVFVNNASKNDMYIYEIAPAKQVVYSTNMLGPWQCPKCQTVNQRFFCLECGEKRPQNKQWYCPSCGELSYWNFCGRCGAKKPE